jgi:hypothetical protein
MGEYLNEPAHPIRCRTDASLLLYRHGVEHDRNGVAVTKSIEMSKMVRTKSSLPRSIAGCPIPSVS